MSVATSDLDLIVDLSRNLMFAMGLWGLQALVVLGAAWSAIRLDRSKRATVRYRIWLVAFLISGALPLLGVMSRALLVHGGALPIAWPVGAMDPTPPGGGMKLAGEPEFSGPSLAWPVLCMIWAAGMMTALARFGFSRRRLNRIRSSARRVTAADLNCPAFQSHLDRSRSPEIALSPEVSSPMLIGLFQPAILLPSDILSWTSPEERMSILRHELAHIRRYDPVVHLIATLLRACHFYHPMVRFACSQLSLERELACDEQVLDLGTKPLAYVESLLKAVERNMQNDAVHSATSFASRKRLERRIDMIMDASRIRNHSGQWRFLLLPAALILLVTWLVLPGAPGKEVSEIGAGVSAPMESLPARSLPPAVQTHQSPPVVDKATIWVETVKRGTMIWQVRGLGVLRADTGGRFRAELQFPEGQAKDLRVGQPASIDTRKGIVPGKVLSIGATDAKGSIVVQVSLEGYPPSDIGPGAAVDGTVRIGELPDILHMGRPVRGQANTMMELYRIDRDGATATRVHVKLGRSSVNTIQVLEGLNEGDKVIISDMSRYAGVQSVRLN
jgi:beta-lactamase regulating signal transducer with metallopeptidase domain